MDGAYLICNEATGDGVVESSRCCSLQLLPSSNSLVGRGGWLGGLPEAKVGLLFIKKRNIPCGKRHLKQYNQT